MMPFAVCGPEGLAKLSVKANEIRTAQTESHLPGKLSGLGFQIHLTLRRLEAAVTTAPVSEVRNRSAGGDVEYRSAGLQILSDFPAPQRTCHPWAQHGRMGTG